MPVSFRWHVNDKAMTYAMGSNALLLEPAQEFVDLRIQQRTPLTHTLRIFENTGLM